MPTVEAKLGDFLSMLHAIRIAEQPIEVDAIVQYQNKETDIIIEHFPNRVTTDDHVTNPSWPWSHASPKEHLLHMNNIHPPGEKRPLLTAKYLVRAPRRTFDEPFDLKLPAVYAVFDEHLAAMGIATDIQNIPALITLQPIAGSAIKNAEDNDLPKLYLSRVKWTDDSLQRPRPGDLFKTIMPFKIPDCHQAADPARRKPERKFTGDRNDAGIVNEHAEITQVRETAEENCDFERRSYVMQLSNAYARNGWQR